jgi:class 3 adenylate cyclase
VSEPDHPLAVDELLDRALTALAKGDRATADLLAGQVLAVDRNNADAEDLLAAPAEHGEIRRLTILFADLVDSTALSTRIEPEIYRTVVGRYRDDVIRIVERYEGHIGSTKGDGLLAFFGHPQAHEDDVLRAVQAGLDITREIAALSARVRRRFDFDINVRVGIHRGIVYLDTAQDDVYGLAANLAARMCGLAEPGTVAVSDAIEPLIRYGFELAARLPTSVKGVDDPVRFFLVVAERDVNQMSLGPLVGRQHEFAYVEQCWAQVQVGELRLPGVFFIGDAGIGKSRLAWSAVDMAERSHAVVLQLIGSPFHTDVGLRPIRRLLERRCGIGRESDPEERLRYLENEVRSRSLDPATIVPLLAPVLSIEPGSGYQPVRADGRKLSDLIAGAVHDYLLACVRDGPAVVLVEDMHWFDPSTIQVVQDLLNADLGGHVQIVMASRELTSLPDTSRTAVFELEPLTNDEADQLIVALHPEVTTDELRAVRRRCDGVPLYIEEVIAKLKRQPSDESGSVGVPDTLYEALFARLRSSSNAIPVVEAAALIGSRVERNLLLAVVDLPEHDVDQVIGQLVEVRVLEPLEQHNWRFRHELLREVGAELSPPSVRRRLHGRIADVLVSEADEGNPDWPLIARHYERAERYTEAASAYREASADARQRGALGEAQTYLTYALAQVERSPAGADRDRSEIALRLRRGFLIYAAEGVSSPSAAAEFERCLQLGGADVTSAEFVTSDDLFATFCALYGYYAVRADLARVEQLISSVRENLLDSREWFRPFNDAAFGMLSWSRGDFDTARAKLQSAAESRGEVGARELAAIWFMPNEATASIYTHLALAHYVQGDLTAAETELTRTENRCAALEFPQGAFSLAYARQMEVVIRIDAGQLERAAEVALDLIGLGDQHGFDSWAMAGAAQHATVTALSALTEKPSATELATHIATITGFVDLWRALGVITLITFYDAILARLMIAAEQIDSARERLQLALDLADQTGMHFYDAELVRLQAYTIDDPELRSARLRAAVELAQGQRAHIFELRAAADDFEFRGEPARDALTGALGRFPEDSTWPELKRARTLLG